MNLLHTGLLLQKRYGTNYTFTPVEKSADHYTKYHEVPSDQYWNFVERLRPPATVPTFPKLEVYPSGWTPPAGRNDSINIDNHILIKVYVYILINFWFCY